MIERCEGDNLKETFVLKAFTDANPDLIEEITVMFEQVKEGLKNGRVL